MTKISPARRRVLQMLEQQGPTHRHEIGFAFAKKKRMWPQAATRLAGYLCRPMIEEGWVREKRCKRGFHIHMSITVEGSRALRSS